MQRTYLQRAHAKLGTSSSDFGISLSDTDTADNPLSQDMLAKFIESVKSI